MPRGQDVRMTDRDGLELHYNPKSSTCCSYKSLPKVSPMHLLTALQDKVDLLITRSTTTTCPLVLMCNATRHQIKFVIEQPALLVNRSAYELYLFLCLARVWGGVESKYAPTDRSIASPLITDRPLLFESERVLTFCDCRHSCSA